MKFVIVVVLFALALDAAQSSVSPLGPILITDDHHHIPAAVAVHAAVHAAPVHIVTHPVVVPQVVVPHVVAVAPVEGTYVAKTLGAVHVAPLPGHANSAASVNLEPAPGTI